MKFDIDDRQLLLVSGAACTAYGLAGLGAPRKLHELYFEPSQVFDAPMTRWFGLTITSHAGNQLTLSACDKVNKLAIKSGLTVAGASWVACAAMNAYNAQAGIHKQEIGYVSAAAQAAFGALCLWGGMADCNSTKVVAT